MLLRGYRNHRRVRVFLRFYRKVKYVESNVRNIFMRIFIFIIDNSCGLFVTDIRDVRTIRLTDSNVIVQ
jgi:hypothetical protein